MTSYYLDAYKDAQVIFFSDVHLKNCQDERAQLLAEVLHWVSLSQIRQVVFLGDIFDFNLGNHPYFVKKFLMFQSWLELLYQADKNVLFIEGNHELGLEHLPGLNLRVSKQPTYFYQDQACSMTFILCHGDVINASAFTLKIRTIIKSSAFLCLLRFVPGWILDALTRLLLFGLHLKDQWLKPSAPDLNRIAEFCVKSQPDAFIFGHFHLDLDATLPSQKTQIHCGPKWEKPSCLLLTATGELKRVFLEPKLNLKTDIGLEHPKSTQKS